MKIRLAIRKQGPVPAFKNHKRTIRLKNGGMMPVTVKRVKKWMNQCIQGFESQLLCATQIGGSATSTGPCPPSLIASSLPLDDSWDWISEISVRAELVEPGEEGAEITIEKL